MAKINGKLVKLSFSGSDVPFKSDKVKQVYKKADVTDNGSTNVEEQTTRYTAEIEVSGFLYKAGEKQNGKGLKLTYNSVDYKTSDLSYEETADTHETPDGSTSGEGTDIAASFSARKMTASFWQEDTVVDAPLGAAHAATLLFATGVSAVNSALTLESKDIDGEIKNDQKVTVAGFFKGTVTETSLGLAVGTSATATLTLADGSTTDKEVTGTAILASKKISANVNGAVELTYNFKFSGSITENIKS